MRRLNVTGFWSTSYGATKRIKDSPFLVSWKKACRPKQGGLGLKNMFTLKRTLLGKQTMRIIQHLDTLFSKALTSKYDTHNGLLPWRSPTMHPLSGKVFSQLFLPFKKTSGGKLAMELRLISAPNFGSTSQSLIQVMSRCKIFWLMENSGILESWTRYTTKRLLK